MSCEPRPVVDGSAVPTGVLYLEGGHYSSSLGGVQPPDMSALQIYVHPPDTIAEISQNGGILGKEFGCKHIENIVCWVENVEGGHNV